MIQKLYTILFLSFCILGSYAANSGQQSLQEEGFVFDLRVYPNPNSSGKYALQFSSPHKQDEITVKVYNLIGREVYRSKITAHQGMYQGYINIHFVPKGVYMLEISNGEYKHTRRLSFI